MEKHINSVHGKAYYSSDVLNKISVCNGLDRKLILNIYNKKGKLIYKASSEAVDTIYFSYPYPIHAEYNNKGQQEIKAYLRTSYSIGRKEEFSYDTAIIRTFYFKAK